MLVGTAFLKVSYKGSEEGEDRAHLGGGTKQNQFGMRRRNMGTQFWVNTVMKLISTQCKHYQQF